MSLQTVCAIVCLFLAQVAADTGVHFVMERHPDSYFCGHLQCVADLTKSDQNVFTCVEMTIYDITRVNSELKLASVSTFHPDDLYVDTTKSSAMSCTGIISRLQANLTLKLRHDIDCLYGVYKCQLELVTESGHPEVLTEIVIPEHNDNYSRVATVMYTLAEIAAQLKQHSEVTDNQLKALQQDNQVLKALQQDSQLKELQQDNQLKALQQDNEVLKAMLGELLNLTLSTQHDQPLGTICYRDMPHKNARKKFVLSGKVLALCDTETDGGGWVVIQRRVRGDVDFYRGWDDYKRGFGTPNTDFWIGNDIIHDLTSQGYNELRIDFVCNGTDYFAQYTDFSVADESSNFRITISGYSGNSYDSMAVHNNRDFSTPDRDNDLYSKSCSMLRHGSWWYKNCYNANLNGAWAATDLTGIVWTFNSTDYWRSLTFTEMKIRYI